MLFIVFGVAAGAAFLTAVILFFALRVPRTVGYLSGATGRKAVIQIRELGRKETAVHRVPVDDLARTGKISTAKLLGEAGKAEETTVLSSLEPSAQTMVLSQPQAVAGETAMLSPAVLEEAAAQVPEGAFRIVYGIEFIHSEEFIA